MPAVILTAPYLNKSGTCVCPNVFLPQQFKYSEIDSITHEWVSHRDTLDTFVWVYTGAVGIGDREFGRDIAVFLFIILFLYSEFTSVSKPLRLLRSFSEFTESPYKLLILNPS